MPRQAGQQGLPILQMNPEDAKLRELTDGAEILARNDKGVLSARLNVTDTVVAGTTVLEGKYWWDKFGGAPASNRLAEPNRTPGGQPTFNDIFVEVVPAG